MNGLALCAGVGGLELGLERVFPNFRTVAFVEGEAMKFGKIMQCNTCKRREVVVFSPASISIIPWFCSIYCYHVWKGEVEPIPQQE